MYLGRGGQIVHITDGLELSRFSVYCSFVDCTWICHRLLQPRPTNFTIVWCYYNLPSAAVDFILFVVYVYMIRIDLGLAGIQSICCILSCIIYYFLFFYDLFDQSLIRFTLNIIVEVVFFFRMKPLE